jgi:hypothetical protein
MKLTVDVQAVQRACRWLAAILVCVLGGTAFAKENYAVLVGVTVYPVLPEQNHLRGPVNDVAMMRTVLLARGFAESHVQVLADGLPGAQSPTREAILQALARVAQQAKRGDFVYLHFAGHGSQQPEDKRRTDRGHKPNGMNEIFLPRDIGRWDREGETVDNAIADYEMNAVVTGLRNQGVFVWVVFDSCHSASMTRGIAPGDLRFRQVDPVLLGVPADAGQQQGQAAPADGPSPDDDEGQSRLGPPPKLAPDAAGFVAFYAAQTTESTPELTLPRASKDRKSQGLFSFTLAQAIANSGSISYRQLRDYVLQQYATMGYVTVTPLVEGTELDAPIFGDRNAKRVQQWQIARDGAQLTIAAGAVQGISEGARFALLADPLAPDDRALGTLQAGTVKNFQSVLLPATPAEDAGKGAGASSLAVPERAFARLLETRPNFSLTVALPPQLAADSPDQARMRRILATLQQSPPEALRVTWVPAGQPADLRLAFDLGAPGPAGAQLWLLSPTGQLVQSGPQRSHSIALAQPDEALTDKLQDSLVRIARYANLLRVSTQLGGAAEGAGTQVEAVLTRAGSDHSMPMPASAVPKLYDGDIVEFRIHNRGRDPSDVTLLFLDSEYGISAMYPPPGRLNRIEAGGDDTVKIRINADTTGIERMLVIAVPAQPKQPSADFSFLEQPSLPKSRGHTSALEALYTEAAFGNRHSRGASAVPQGVEAHMQLFSWATTQSSEK